MKHTMEIKADTSLIAACGLYCGACRSYLSGKCPGCSENTKATWCKVRTCCSENSYKSCADCSINDLTTCPKFHNFFSKMIGLILNSDRKACIAYIREKGYEAFADEMTSRKRQTMPRQKSV